MTTKNVRREGASGSQLRTTTVKRCVPVLLPNTHWTEPETRQSGPELYAHPARWSADTHMRDDGGPHSSVMSLRMTWASCISSRSPFRSAT